MKKLTYIFILNVSLVVPSIGNASSVFADGKEWRQLTETMFLIPDEIETICNPLCNGSLNNFFNNAIDLSGWTWATSEDVRNLATFYGTPGGNNVTEANSSWAPEFFNNFNSTRTGVTQGFEREFLSGYVFSPIQPPGNALLSSIINSISPLGNDLYGRFRFTRSGSADGDKGVFLYKTSPVPIPAAVWLFGAGLIGLIGIRKKTVSSS